MISTSFLRTLNLKKYQDFTEENKNRLKVFYTRTLSKMKKQFIQTSKTTAQNTSTTRCLCKSLHKPKRIINLKKHSTEEIQKCRPQIVTQELCFTMKPMSNENFTKTEKDWLPNHRAIRANPKTNYHVDKTEKAKKSAVRYLR